MKAVFESWAFSRATTLSTSLPPVSLAVAVANVVVEVGRPRPWTSRSIPPLRLPDRRRPACPASTPTRQDFSVNLNQTSFNDLPNNGRRWSTFAILAPATAPDGPSGAVSFRGISSLLNKNTIDGGDNDQAFFATERGGTRIGYAIGLASIREVHINISELLGGIRRGRRRRD